MDELNSFHILSGYLLFGCACYALAGICALLFVRKKAAAAIPVITKDAELLVRYLLGFMVLELAQGIWDTFAAHHFPMLISRPVLLFLFISVGNTALRLYQQRLRWLQMLVAPMAHQDTPQPFRSTFTREPEESLTWMQARSS